MTYYEDLIRPKNPAFRQNQDLVKVIEEYKLKHPYANDGIRTTITEPGLSNYEVCAFLKEDKAGCALTDTEGNFSIVDSGIRMGDTVGISIKDNSDEKVGTMGYQNRYVKPAVIPAYEMNGIQVPEQNLVQTHLMKLSNTYVVAASEEKIILGLTQGYLPYPPLRGDLYIYSFFDHDERKTYGLDWRGRNGMTPNTYNHIPNKVKDNLNGVDFGGQKGDLVISLGFGVAKITESEELGKQVIVMIDNVPHYIKYSHLDTVLINDMQEVFAGQIIGINGRTGKDVGAPHVHIDVGTSGQDPFGDPYGSYAQIWTRAFSPAEFP